MSYSERKPREQRLALTTAREWLGRVFSPLGSHLCSSTHSVVFVCKTDLSFRRTDIISVLLCQPETVSTLLAGVGTQLKTDRCTKPSPLEHTHTYAYMLICIHMHTYTYIYMHTYICMCTCTHLSLLSNLKIVRKIWKASLSSPLFLDLTWTWGF